jgi:hypothetical protein
MRPKSKWDRVVLTELIIEAGLTLIAEAETAKKLTKLTRARMVRNGLIQALLAPYPMRRKNFAALEIGRSIVKQNGTWWIILTAAETKEKRADERPIEDYIGKTIDKYLQTYRPILGRGKSNSNALWLAETGEAIAESYVGELITETARLTLGAPSTGTCSEQRQRRQSAIHAGDMPHLGSAFCITPTPPSRWRTITVQAASARVGPSERLFSVFATRGLDLQNVRFN